MDSASYLNEKAFVSLIMQLHLLGDYREGFELVYPNAEHPSSGIQIWKVEYPEDVTANPAYLERSFRNDQLYEPLPDY